MQIRYIHRLQVGREPHPATHVWVMDSDLLKQIVMWQVHGCSPMSTGKRPSSCHVDEKAKTKEGETVAPMQARQGRRPGHEKKLS